MGVSLDGFIAGPKGELDWSTPDEELHQFYNEEEAEIGTALYGRRLYELMSDFWPTADQDPDAEDVVVAYARLWRALPKVVFSTTLTSVSWNSRLVREDLPGEVARLRAEPGKKLSVGGAGLAASLLRLGLIDEFRLALHPVVLGAGTPMFPALDPQISLRLVSTRTFAASGTVLLSYARVSGSSARS